MRGPLLKLFLVSPAKCQKQPISLSSKELSSPRKGRLSSATFSPPGSLCSSTSSSIYVLIVFVHALNGKRLQLTNVKWGGSFRGETCLLLCSWEGLKHVRGAGLWEN